MWTPKVPILGRKVGRFKPKWCVIVDFFEDGGHRIAATFRISSPGCRMAHVPSLRQLPACLPTVHRYLMRVHYCDYCYDYYYYYYYYYVLLLPLMLLLLLLLVYITTKHVPKFAYCLL